MCILGGYVGLCTYENLFMMRNLYRPLTLFTNESNVSH